MTKNWRIIREGVQHRSPSSMINENQVDDKETNPSVKLREQ